MLKLNVFPLNSIVFFRVDILEFALRFIGIEAMILVAKTPFTNVLLFILFIRNSFFIHIEDITIYIRNECVEKFYK